MVRRSDRAENGGELSAVRSGYTRPAFVRRARLHGRDVDPHRRRDGNLSGAGNVARRSRRRLEGRRPQYERQRAPAALSQIPDRRAGRVVGHVARRRGVAHNQLCAAKPAKHRLSPRQSLDRLRDFAAGALPRRQFARAFRGANTRRLA